MNIRVQGSKGLFPIEFNGESFWKILWSFDKILSNISIWNCEAFHSNPWTLEPSNPFLEVAPFLH